MASETLCPEPNTLDDLLANRLTADKAKLIREHLTGCEKCQRHVRGEDVPRQPPPTFSYLSPPRTADELGWLGEYRIVGMLGEGGMSVVFDAEEPLLHRKVALKVLRPQFNDPVMRERFLREARTIASLPAEHVVQVFSVGEENGIPYLAMERLQGESLASRLRRDRTLPVVEAIKIAREAAEGLVALHERALVHRDIKPDNLWLEYSSDGRFKGVKLIDFGVARVVSGDSGLTLPGQVIGTPAYMAPEQAAGLPVDGRADLYALGCVLYRMVTGYTPFDNSGPNTLMVLDAVIKGDAPKVREMAPTLSPAVADFIQQLMSRSPEKRPATAAIVAERLKDLEQEERLATGKTQLIQSLPASATRRTPRRAAPLSLILGGLAIGAALIVGALAAYYKFWPEEGGVVAKRPPIKVGVLYSQTGTTAVHELPIIDAVQLAIDEINESGGVLGRPLEPIIADGASNEKTFERRASEIIEEEAVVVFGCWLSSARRRVAEVCEKHDRLLFYAPSNEGLHASPNVIYLGGTPNQTVIPLIKYAISDLLKDKFFLLGSEDVYSHSVAAILEHEITQRRAKVVGTHYAMRSETDFASVVEKIKESGANIIINSLDGVTSNEAFLQALHRAELKPPEVVVAWLALSEPEIGLFSPANIVGDYTAGCYFERINVPSNKEFLALYRKRFGKTKRVNDTMQTAYAGVYLWKKAVEQSKSTDTSTVREALRGMTVDAPEGPIKIDVKNLHAWRTARVARIERIEERLDFRIVYQTPEPIEPDPFPAWKTKKEWEAFLNDLYVKWGNAWERSK